MHNNITNALTVDVEDFFHVSAFKDSISRTDWDTFDSRVERNTQNLLELFARHNVKATFFVLGWCADRFPGIVKSIAAMGHEVACHGYSHQLVYTQTQEDFREETYRAKSIIEDIIQKPVIGYRAASYSITKRSDWALDILVDAGFKYDSSIFPTRHDLYGMPGTPKFPYVINTPKNASLIEFPLSTKRIFGYDLPVAGGGYFRLYPYAFTKFALKSINQTENEPFIFYLHPWEIDPQQPRIKTNFKSRFRHYNNLDKCEVRLDKLLEDFDFSTVESVLNHKGLLPASFDYSRAGHQA